MSAIQQVFKQQNKSSLLKHFLVGGQEKKTLQEH